MIPFANKGDFSRLRVEFCLSTQPNRRTQSLTGNEKYLNVQFLWNVLKLLHHQAYQQRKLKAGAKSTKLSCDTAPVTCCISCNLQFLN